MQLYAREWLPVFLSQPHPPYNEVHLFDFFAGPGADSEGRNGSPIRLIEELARCRSRAGFHQVKIHLHLFDENEIAVERLRERISVSKVDLPGVIVSLVSLPFDQALKRCLPILSDARAAKLVLIDQFGVKQVTDDTFKALTRFPTCDFLFFIASSTLNRFHAHPAIKQKIQKPLDSFHVHRETMRYYKNLLDKNARFFLGSFSIKKGSNIYGLIFGSGHQLGMDKFLQVAWRKDHFSGEANYDIDRDGLVADQPFLALDGFGPTKLSVFEGALERQLRDKAVHDEKALIALCHEHGVTRQHSKPVLAKLRKEGVIQLDFEVPNIKFWNKPRPIRYQ